MKLTRFVAFGFVCSIAVLAVSTSAFAPPSPNPSFTPGATDPHVRQATIKQMICTRGRSTTHRNVSTRTSNEVYATYHIKKSNRTKYVIDHLVPLEVGGTNSLTNLWPEPKNDAKTKDKLAAQMHAAVCSGRLTLAAAQAKFMTTAVTTTVLPTTPARQPNRRQPSRPRPPQRTTRRQNHQASWATQLHRPGRCLCVATRSIHNAAHSTGTRHP